MENQFQLTSNGQEMQQADVNALGVTAALADDRVLWELLRLLPVSGGLPQKGILTFGQSGWGKPFGLGSGLANAGLVQPGVIGSATVRVMPFRAIIGSLTAPAAPSATLLESIRGERSGYSFGLGSVPYSLVTITPNASGQPRWDLVYATFSPSVSTAAVTRYVKDPTSGAVTAPSIVTQLQTSTTLTVAAGTPGASPTRPALPGDGGNLYNIPLAYIWVPNGFGAASSVGLGTIHEHAPVICLNSATGVSNIQPANQSFTIGGVVDTRQAGTTTRTGAYLPSTMVGGETRVIPLQLGLNPKSHQTGDVVDNSVNWLNRFFKWTVIGVVGTTTASANSSDKANTGAGAQYTGNSTPGVNMAVGMGESFAAAPSTPFSVFPANMSAIPALTAIALQVNAAGNLIITITGSPNFNGLIWLEATAPYANFSLLV